MSNTPRKKKETLGEVIITKNTVTVTNAPEPPRLRGAVIYKDGSEIIAAPVWPTERKSYEYRVITHNTNTSGTGESQINTLAADGWRLVAVSGDVVKFMYFEREI